MTISSSSLSKSKVVFGISMIMAILVSFNLNVGMSDDSVIPRKISVTMNNKLNDMQLGIRCKEKHWDSGFKIVPVGLSWTFIFHPNPIIFRSLFYCSFTWSTGDLHYFDIYDAKRDVNVCTQCVWDISEKGPCRVSGFGAPMCFPWNN
ncbi:hypothetical protein PIB30_030880 [Stylosanthes scabra]|uniref:S-protein homolog n=1 Tax=Stylosanthes scabra TaxID=79078 RepID=A0ABU6WBX8_9FABA|nr:hypothetical protein [Stylosanthes scabra]